MKDDAGFDGIAGKQSFRTCRCELLSLLVQRKVTKESTPQAVRPALRSGFAGSAGIPERRASCAPPCGFSPQNPPHLKGPLEKQLQKQLQKLARGQPECPSLQQLLLLLSAFDFLGPLRRGGGGGEEPAGRRTWTCAVSGRGRMPRPEIPGPAADLERAARKARRRVAFLLVTFLWPRKEK